MKNSYKIRHLSVILMLLLALSLSGCRTKNLISPVVFKIPSTIPDEKIAKAVKKASIKRNWIPFDEKDGVISVRLEVRQHIVKYYVPTYIVFNWRHNAHVLYNIFLI